MVILHITVYFLSILATVTPNTYSLEQHPHTPQQTLKTNTNESMLPTTVHFFRQNEKPTWTPVIAVGCTVAFFVGVLIAVVLIQRRGSVHRSGV
eukprot:2075496-Rhodomonas_salina.2